MKKIFLPVLLIAALVLVSGCAQGGQKSTTSPSPTQEPIKTEVPAAASPIIQATEAASPTETPSPSPSEQTSSGKTVEVTSSGFSPSTVTVKAGESVTFTNKDASPHWPASAVHPTHKVYPGSDFAKCSDPVEKAKIFDACSGLEQGESWSFAFSEKGTWRYHDHLNPGSTGTIVVE